MKLTSKSIILLSTIALLGGIGVAQAPAASAIPSCSVAADRTGVAATCSGSGQFRLFYTCYAAFPWQSTWTRYGSWVTSPRSSVLNVGYVCGVTNQYQAGVQKR